MLRNIHFFNLKPGVDEATALAVLDGDVVEYAKSHGCIERRTWKLLDAHPDGSAPALYLNEALWPSQALADAYARTFGQDESPLAKRAGAVFECITIVQNLRFVDDEG
jgi:hypothetical protein